jgi:hypothetical protein
MTIKITFSGLNAKEEIVKEEVISEETKESINEFLLNYLALPLSRPDIEIERID